MGFTPCTLNPERYAIKGDVRSLDYSSCSAAAPFVVAGPARKHRACQVWAVLQHHEMRAAAILEDNLKTRLGFRAQGVGQPDNLRV